MTIICLGGGGGRGERGGSVFMLELAKSGICIIFGCGVCCQYLSHGVLMFVMNILWF